MFDIGQKVKCIDGRWGDATGTKLQLTCCPNLPVVGSIYTIRYTTITTAAWADGPCLFVRLMEIVNPLNVTNEEPVFQGKQFVPIGREKETNIEFAQQLLEDPTKIIKRDKEEIEIFRTKKGKRHERA
jgi:hypothetical protein